MAVVGVLTALFKLDASEAEKTAEKLQRTLGNELQDSLKGMGRSAGIAGDILAKLGPIGVAVGAAIGAATTAIVFGTKSLIEMGDRLTNLSRQFRLSTDEIQRLEAGGRGLGISIEALAKESGFLEKALGGRSSGVLKALDELNLSYTALSRMPADERLIAIHRALLSIQDPLKQSALGAELLGKGFQKMTETDLAEFLEEAGGAIILTQNAAKAGYDLGDAWDRLKADSKVLASEGFAPLAEDLTAILNLITDIQRSGGLPDWLVQGVQSGAPFGGGAAFALGKQLGSGAMSDQESERIRQFVADKMKAADEERLKRLDVFNDARLKADEEAEAKRKKAQAELEKAQKAAAEAAKLEAGQIAKFTDQMVFDWEQSRRIAFEIKNIFGEGVFTPISGFGNVMDLGGSRFPGMTLDVPGIKGPDFEPLNEDLDEFGLSLESAADLAIIFGDQLGTFGDALLQGSAAGALISDDFEDLSKESQALQVGMAGLAGAMAIFNATMTGSPGSRAAGGAMAGATAGAQIGGAIMPGIGALIGLGVGAAAGGIVGWLRGQGPAQVGEDAGRDMGASLSQALMEAIHKSGLNAQMFLREIWEEGGIGLDRLAEEVGDLFSMFERGEISKETVFSELQEGLPILIEHFEELGPAGQENVNRIIEAAKRLGVDLGAAGDALERLQAGIPETTLEGMAEQLGISVEKARELAELMGVGMQTDLERMADDLNVPVEALQAAFDALSAQGLADEMGDIQTILDSMGITIEELLAKLGIELPEAATTAEEAIPEGEGALDPVALGNTAGDVIAKHLVPGQKQMSTDISAMRADVHSLPDAIARAVKDAIAQGP